MTRLAPTIAALAALGAVTAGPIAATAEPRAVIDRPPTLPLGGWRLGLAVHSDRADDTGAALTADLGLPLGFELRTTAAAATAGVPVGSIGLAAGLVDGPLLTLTAQLDRRYAVDGSAATAVAVEASLRLGPVEVFAGGERLHFAATPVVAARTVEIALGFPVGLAVQLGSRWYLRADADLALAIRPDGLVEPATRLAPATATAIAGLGPGLELVAAAGAGPAGAVGTVGIRVRGGR